MKLVKVIEANKHIVGSYPDGLTLCFNVQGCGDCITHFVLFVTGRDPHSSNYKKLNVIKTMSIDIKLMDFY